MYRSNQIIGVAVFLKNNVKPSPASKHPRPSLSDLHTPVYTAPIPQRIEGMSEPRMDCSHRNPRVDFGALLYISGVYGLAFLPFVFLSFNFSGVRLLRRN